MQTITVERTISIGHRLPSYEGICSSPHGHNITVSVTLETYQFVDFKAVREHLDGLLHHWDHAMLLYNRDPILPFFQEKGFRAYMTPKEPTTEHLAELVLKHMYTLYVGKVRSVTVQETAQYSATVTP